MTHTNSDKLRPALRDARLIHAPAPDNYRAPICGRAIPSDHAVTTSVAEWDIIADHHDEVACWECYSYGVGEN